MIVYTSIYGQYDQLRPHPEHPGVEVWVCFTDDPDLKCDGWDVVVEPPRFPHPRLSAKWRKCHPPVANRTLWIDGSIDLHNLGLVDAVNERLDDFPVTMFTHPWRDCIYDEVEASRPMPKYRDLGAAMYQQVGHYRAHGWPEHGGLWASTVIGRRGSPEVVAMGAAWFAHCETFTYQDQLSLPYLLRAYDLEVGPLPYALHQNPWYVWQPHRSEL